MRLGIPKFDDYVNIDDNASLNFGTGDFAISAWIYIASFPTGEVGGIISKRTPGGAKYWQFEVRDDKRVEAFIEDDVSAFSVASSASSLSENTWHHVLLTVDRTVDNGAKIYLEGSVAGQADWRTSSGINNNDDVTIGWEKANDDYIDGFIDEVIIWDRNLSAAEVTSLHAEQNSGTEMSSGNALWDANLISVWHMNSSWADDKGGNDGTRFGNGTEFDAINPKLGGAAGQFTEKHIELNPTYDSQFSTQSQRDQYRSLDGTHYVYQWSTWRKFELPESWVSSADRLVVNSWWDSRATLSFYEDEINSPNSFHTVRITNNSEPYPRFVEPYFLQLYRGSLMLETL